MILSTSTVAQGILTWAIPLAVLIVVLVWYILLVRGRHPE
jgi:hypothetical protein